MEESLRHHGALLDEVGCLEKTLLRRRAELREADRLLLEAQSSLKDTRTKVTYIDIYHIYNVIRKCIFDRKKKTYA